MKPKFSKSFLVLAWYRPPKCEHETLNTLETLLKTIENENKEIMLIGDINCNELNIDDKNKVIEHLRKCLSTISNETTDKVSHQINTDLTNIDRSLCFK